MRAPWTAALLGFSLVAPGAQAEKKAPTAPLEVHATAELTALLPKLAKGRPLVLHFCATWCEACRDEFKQLHDLFAGLEARGVSLELVWIDDEKTRGAIPKMTARYRLQGMPSMVLDAPEPEPVAAAMGEKQWEGGLPATFVFGVKGEKLSTFLGTADPGLLRAAVEEAIRRAR